MSGKGRMARNRSLLMPLFMGRTAAEAAITSQASLHGAGVYANLAGPAVKLVCLASLGLALANCAGPTNRQASRSKEVGAFSDPKYGKASPRVVGVDEAAPKGGGRYQVGKAYSVAGRTYVPRENMKGYSVSGAASWYGIAFHGRKTANGEVYDRNNITAAHPTMPLPSYARVTNLNNNHSIIVRVNDRGPYHSNRVLDVSERTANLLQFRHIGTARVKVDYLGPASLQGSDDTKLIASLRQDGPANAPFLPGTGPTLVASASLAPAAAPAPAPLAFREVAPQPAPAPAGLAAAKPLPGKAIPAPNAPLPPERPFDLETIGNAASPVQLGQAKAAAPIRQASLPRVHPIELAMQPSDGLFARFGADHAFSGVGELVPARDYAALRK